MDIEDILISGLEDLEMEHDKKVNPDKYQTKSNEKVKK